MSRVQVYSIVLAVLFILVIIGMKSEKPLTVSGRPETEFESIPMDFDGWIGINSAFSADTYEALPTCSLLLRYYSREGMKDSVELAIVYGTNLGDFHQPEVCLEGQGHMSLKKGDVSIEKSDGGTINAVSLITQAGGSRRAFLYWFYSKGTTSTFLGEYKLRILMDRLVKKEIEPSAMIRISVRSDGDDEAAVRELVEFSEDVVPYLEKEFTSTRNSGEQ